MPCATCQFLFELPTSPLLKDCHLTNIKVLFLLKSDRNWPYLFIFCNTSSLRLRHNGAKGAEKLLLRRDRRRRRRQCTIRQHRQTRTVRLLKLAASRTRKVIHLRRLEARQEKQRCSAWSTNSPRKGPALFPPKVDQLFYTVSIEKGFAGKGL